MKKIQTDTDNDLVVIVRSRLIAWVGGLGLFFLADMLRTLYFHLPGKDRLIGLAGASCTCILVFLAFYEKCSFTFDRRTRILTWSRQRGFWKRAGTLPFAAIKNVVLQTCLGKSRYCPEHRVMLVISGGELPITVAYEHDDMNEIIARRIREVLDKSPARLVEDSIELLIAKGRDVDAIRLLREKSGLSLTEAHSMVARIKEGKGPETLKR